jgi:hypothetical protein
MIAFLKSIIRFPLTGQPQPTDWGALLAADVERRKNSFPVQDYRRRRAAALKATRA